MLYCKTEFDLSKDISETTLDEDVSNLIAKVDSRSTTKAGDVVKLAIDVTHCHLFDKSTEVTILARSEEDKESIQKLQAVREEEDAKKAAEEAERLAIEEEKARIKMEKKMGFLSKKKAKKEEVTEDNADNQ